MVKKIILPIILLIILVSPICALTEYQASEEGTYYGYENEVNFATKVLDGDIVYWYIEYNIGDSLTGTVILDDDGDPITDEKTIRDVIVTARMYWLVNDMEISYYLSTANIVTTSDLQQYADDMDYYASISQDKDLIKAYEETADDIEAVISPYSNFQSNANKLNAIVKELSSRDVTTKDGKEIITTIRDLSEDFEILSVKYDTLANDFSTLEQLETEDYILAGYWEEDKLIYREAAGYLKSAKTEIDAGLKEFDNTTQWQVEDALQRAGTNNTSTIAVILVLGFMIGGTAISAVVMYFIIKKIRSKRNRRKKRKRRK